MVGVTGGAAADVKLVLGLGAGHIGAGLGAVAGVGATAGAGVGRGRIVSGRLGRLDWNGGGVYFGCGFWSRLYCERRDNEL